MRILDFYVGTRVARGYLLVMFLLASVFSFLVLVDELDDVGEGRYQSLDALVFVALTLPSRIMDLLPFVALLGSIIALGWLAGSNELLVMRAAGVSVPRIGWSVLKSGILLMLAAAVVAEFVAPPLERMAHMRRSFALSESGTLSTERGFWSRDQGRFVNIRHVLPDGRPAGIDIYEFDPQGRLERFIQAREASIGEGGQWLLTDVEQKRLDGSEVSVQHLDALPWESFMSTRTLSLLVVPLESLAPSDLYRVIQDLRAQGQNVYRYELVLWRRLSIPLATGVMILLSIPFEFGSTRSTTAGYRIVLGAVVGIAFYLVNQIVGHLGLLLGLNPALTALAPVAVMLAIAVLWLRRLR